MCPVRCWIAAGEQLSIPLGYARGLAAAAIQAGAAVHGGTRVTRIERNGERWRLETATGTVSAGAIVLATNGYTDDVWPGLRRSIVPVYSAIVASEPAPDDVMPSRSSLYEMGDITVYYRKDRDHRVLMGGRAIQRDIARPEELQHLIDYAVRLWPAAAWKLRWLRHHWSGATRHHHRSLSACPPATARNCPWLVSVTTAAAMTMSTAMGAAPGRGGSWGRRIAMPEITGIRRNPRSTDCGNLAVQARIACYGFRIRDALGL